MTKKITVEKNEGIAEVIDRVLAEAADEVVVVIPKGSILGKSSRNFALLKREAEAEGKSVFVESPDEVIMAGAKAMGIAKSPIVSHPATGVSDIVMVRRGSAVPEEDSESAASSDGKRRVAGGAKRKIDVVPEVEESEEPMEDDDDDLEDEDSGAEEGTGKSHGFFSAQTDRFFKNRTLQDSESDENADGDASRGKSGWKWVGIVVLLVVLIGLGAWGVAAFFGHVAVTINFTKTPWQYEGSFTADKSASSINATAGIIPAQVFSINKNTTQLFPATSEQNISTKATGVLTIYNAYSSANQSLVATTRFVTPDGKIFRLINSVVVPGAKITNGQIVPSSINAPVIADQAGPSYNVGPIAKLTVPGFANTAKATGFYGAIASSTSGGFTGEKAVPTASDVAAAKAKMTSILQTDLGQSLAGTYPNNFIILPGASTTLVTKLTVNTTTDQNGNFSVFGEATLSAIGFDQVIFKTFLLTLAQSTEPSSTFSAFTPEYTNVTPDFTKGTVTFTLNAQGSLEPAFTSSTFDATIEGMSIASARGTIAALPQLANGSISVWPSWLWTIPSDPKKIDISVN